MTTASPEPMIGPEALPVGEPRRPRPSPDAMSAWAWRVAALLTGVTVLDGLDLQLASLSAPVLVAEWHLTKSALAPLLAAALIGMTIGSLAGSWAGDRVGRRPVIVVSVTLFATGTIACGLADHAPLFAILRFASGLGFGAATPCVAAMMSESIPQRHVGRALGVMAIGIPVGGFAGSLATSFLLPAFGWRFCFVGAGGLCLAFAMLLLRLLPESQAFLAGGSTGKERADHGNRFRLLFARENRRLNAGLYALAFSSALALYMSAGWLTVILTDLKLPLATAIRGTAFSGGAAIVGALAAGWMVGRFGSRAMMLLAAALGFTAASILAVITAMLTGGELKVAILGSLLLFGLFVGGIQPSLYLVGARAYPARMWDPLESTCRHASLSIL